MPKKTKKEKIIAQLRRKLETTKAKDQTWEVGDEKRDTEVRKDGNLTTGSVFKLPIIQNIPPQHLISNISLPVSFSYILKDLRKTFFWAGLAISFEFIIYWLIELGGSKLFKFLPMMK